MGSRHNLSQAGTTRPATQAVFAAALLAAVSLALGSIAKASFLIETVDPVSTAGNYSALALDVSGIPHISYMAGDTQVGNLNYAVRTENGWVRELVDACNCVRYTTSIAVGPDTVPQIAYGNARYARRVNGAWEREFVDPGGAYPSIALDGSGAAAVGYYLAHGETGSLRYAERQETGWIITTVDSAAGQTGKFTSLKREADGTPHVLYYREIDSAHAEMRYATRQGGVWNTEVIESVGPTAFLQISLALDLWNRPHVTYYDYATARFRYAVRGATGWVLETISASDHTGGESSLAVDGCGDPHIACLDVPPSGDDNLVYFRRGYSGWDSVVVDAEGDVGDGPSIALDATGCPQFSYLYQSGWDLRHARKTDCTILTCVPDSVGGGSVASTSSELAQIAGVCPNPVRNGQQASVLVVGWTGLHSELQVLDVQGHVLLRRSLAPTVARNGRTLSVDLARLPAGVYICRLAGTGGSRETKILVQFR